MTTFLIIFCIAFFGSLIIGAIYNKNKAATENANQTENERFNNKEALIVYTEMYEAHIYSCISSLNEQFDKYSEDEIEAMVEDCKDALVRIWQKKVNDVYDTTKITKIATKYILAIIVYVFFDMENFLKQKQVPFEKFDIIHQLTRASDNMLENIYRSSFGMSQDIIYRFLAIYGGHK
jgi:uncharacterized protein YyaL (SSP411 family)